MLGRTLCVALLAFVAIVAAQTPPTWPAQYFLSGSLTIVNDWQNLSVPMSVTTDTANQRQAYSYWRGVDTFIYRGDINQTFQASPKVGQEHCWHANDTYKLGLFMVPFLPDLTGWNYGGTDGAVIMGLPCDYWTQVLTMFNRTMTYTYFVSKLDGRPVMFAMEGVQRIFTSHPDNYFFTVESYIPNYAPLDAFTPPAVCANKEEFPNSALVRRIQMLGQLRALLPPDAVPTYPDAFDDHVHRYARLWASPSHPQYARRRAIYDSTVRMVQAHNANPANTYRIAVNKYADLELHELRAMLHGVKGSRSQVNRRPIGRVTRDKSTPLPVNFNWFSEGAVSPVVTDQMSCGSCWSFGTAQSVAGALVAQLKMPLNDFSPQQIMDCAWTKNDSACNGGVAEDAMTWIASNGGLALHSDYQYMDADGFCNSGVKVPFTLKGHFDVAFGDEAALQQALYQYGPIAIAIDAAGSPEFYYYESGIINYSSCDPSRDALDHEVTLIGWGEENGVKYWLVKNSWDTTWGMEGYFMFIYGSNMCGVASDATVPVLSS